MFTVTKLDRAFRSVPDANDVIQGLADRGVKFGLGGSIYDWNDPFGRMFLQMLAVFAEFEANLALLRQPIPPALWSDLRQAGLLHANAPVPAG